MVFKIIIIGSNEGADFLLPFNNQSFNIISAQNNPRVVKLVKNELDLSMQINNIFFDNESLIAEGVVVNNQTRCGGNVSLRLIGSQNTDNIVDAEILVN